MASSNLVTYITRNHPSAQSTRISLTPGPTSGKGRQSSGGSPRCSFRSWYPASALAISGNARRSSREDPHQPIDFSLNPERIKFCT